MLSSLTNGAKIVVLIVLAVVCLAVGGLGGAMIGERATRAAYAPLLDELRQANNRMARQLMDDSEATAGLQAAAREIGYQLGKADAPVRIVYRTRVKTITDRIPPIVQEIVRHVPTDCRLPADVRVLHDEAVAIANGADPDAGDRPERLRAAGPVEAAAFVQTAAENLAIAGQNAAKLSAVQAKYRNLLDVVERYNEALEGASGTAAETRTR